MMHHDLDCMCEVIKDIAFRTSPKEFAVITRLKYCRIITNDISDNLESFFNLFITLFGQATIIDTKSSSTLAKSQRFPPY